MSFCLWQLLKHDAHVSSQWYTITTSKLKGAESMNISMTMLRRLSAELGAQPRLQQDA